MGLWWADRLTVAYNDDLSESITPIMYVVPPPGYGKNIFIFFLKLDHFLRTFCKKCIFTIENPKKT